MPAVLHTLTIQKDATSGDLVFGHTKNGADLGTLTNDDPLVVNPGEKVNWKSDLGNFSILFSDDSPFNDDGVSLGAKKNKTSSTRVCKSLGGTPTSPQSTTFKYAVTVIDGTGAITVDPLLEIDDSGGGI